MPELIVSFVTKYPEDSSHYLPSLLMRLGSYNRLEEVQSVVEQLYFELSTTERANFDAVINATMQADSMRDSGNVAGYVRHVIPFTEHFSKFSKYGDVCARTILNLKKGSSKE